ncbi:MAG: lycopene cyclase domain-containing protein [Candidatus Promineifilaceae bacterium]
MTYFGFLLRFLMIPIVILSGIAWWDKRRGKLSAETLRSWPMISAIALHVVIAVVYTTPWDNYLVATRVWWYDTALVTNITIGWVPIEEYTFFVLQPIMGGLWLWFLMRTLAVSAAEPLKQSLRLASLIGLGTLWVVMLVILLSGWGPGTYLALELVWALPPIMLQLGFGADILWRYRTLVALAIVPTTLYLAFADALAINWGTWTIDPEQSLNIFLGGVLPIEEFVFFLLTNVLVVFGVTLISAEASHKRLAQIPFLRERLASTPS